MVVIQRPGPLGWAVFLSAALHAALLGGWYRPRAGAMDESGVLRLQVVAASLREPTDNVLTDEASASHLLAGTPEEPRPVIAAQPLPTPTPAETSPQAQAAPAPPPPRPDPASYKTTQQGLDPAPRFVQDIEPEYPASASLQEGSVVLRFLINARGEIDELTVLRSTPPGVFDAAALRAYAKARFTPGYFLGIAVPSQKTIEVFFTPTNRAGAVNGTAPTMPR